MPWLGKGREAVEVIDTSGWGEAPMSEIERNTATIPRCSAPHRAGKGFDITVLPASRYEVNYLPTQHVIGFTFEPQRGLDAFGGSRRRIFDAEPWRIAFTPAGCDVFSSSDRGGEYLTLSVEPETFARFAPEVASGSLRQFTNVADPPFTRFALGLRRATMIAAAISPLAIEVLAAAAVQRVSVLLNGGKPMAKPRGRMTSRRLKRILDYFEARLAGEIHLADLAAEVGLSESYLARTFEAATGTTLHAALMDRRIARARLLIEAALRRGVRANLADVAAATGFSSHAHMTTAFRRVLGVTPSEWQRVIASPSPLK